MATEFEYDVFLSHASADKPAVWELAERRKEDGLRVWLDEWVIQPGDLVSLKIEHGLESSRMLVLVMSQAAFVGTWKRLVHFTSNLTLRGSLHRGDCGRLKTYAIEFSFCSVNTAGILLNLQTDKQLTCSSRMLAVMNHCATDSKPTLAV